MYKKIYVLIRFRLCKFIISGRRFSMFPREYEKRSLFRSIYTWNSKLQKNILGDMRARFRMNPSYD